MEQFCGCLPSVGNLFDCVLVLRHNIRLLSSVRDIVGTPHQASQDFSVKVGRLKLIAGSWQAAHVIRLQAAASRSDESFGGATIGLIRMPELRNRRGCEATYRVGCFLPRHDAILAWIHQQGSTIVQARMQARTTSASQETDAYCRTKCCAGCVALCQLTQMLIKWHQRRLSEIGISHTLILQSSS